jgi:DNA-binding transcriptional LysR family regulator
LVGRAAVRVPHFAAVPPLLQVTDMVATLPRRLALWTAAHFPLVWLDLPYTPKTVDIEMVSDQSADRDKGLRWLIDELAASIDDVAPAS